jgi:hypothetical protein
MCVRLRFKAKLIDERFKRNCPATWGCVPGNYFLHFHTIQQRREETLSLKTQRFNNHGAQTPASFISAFLLLRTDFKSCANAALPKLFG